MAQSNTQAEILATQPAAQSGRRVALLLLTGAVVLLLLWLGLKAYRMGTAVQSLLARQPQAEALLEGGLGSLNPDAAEELVLGLRQDIVTLKRESAFLMPLTPHLAWVPKAGPLLAAAPELMAMADAGTETAVHTFNGLKPALVLLQTDSEDSQMSALVHILDEAEPDLILANAAMTRLVAARQALGDISGLPWRVRQLFERADPWLPLAQDGLQTTLILPELMGMEEPRTYLIIIQNEDEVRATGGFITGAGLLHVADGRIASLEFQDGNYIDNWAEKPYEFPPQPFYDFMALELFFYRDANFWPDFPTSAETAIRLYSYGQDVPEADGAIAIDQQFVRLLLQGIGPVTIADTGQTLTAQNVISHFQDAWAKTNEQSVHDWYSERKTFLGTFGQAIQSKIESGLGDIDPLTLAKSLHTAAETGHMQIYMRDPKQMALFDGLNWDGRLENPAGQDFLSVIDSNMGYNKVNMHVTRSLDYAVQLHPDGRADAALTIYYTNNAPLEPEETGCYQDTLLDYGNAPAYKELADECYWNYLRVYVPGGSTLTNSSSHEVPLETLAVAHQGWHGPAQTLNEFADWSTFANFILVPQQETVAVSLAYVLPEVVKVDGREQSSYQLTLRPQAGARPQTVQVTVTLPTGAQLLSTTPESTSDANQVTFTLQNDAVTTLMVNYTLPNH
ncbi:MAG TPA: DUF4012 domain-containing protein [Chloroflexota bacterium]|nr:DUF4012 domain-containing protein [Chloroflexota bacterium]